MGLKLHNLLYLMLVPVSFILVFSLKCNAEELSVNVLMPVADTDSDISEYLLSGKVPPSDISVDQKSSQLTGNKADKNVGFGSSAGLVQLEELGLLSAALVEKAESGSSPAHEFRIQARMYRELLRQTMLSDRENPLPAQLPQDLLLDMVRMSALLHSAADCKTGFVITCPADLMLQLKSQQARVDQGLKMARMIRE